MGVSGIVNISEALAKNTTLKTLNLYRNILDVDGARALGALLKVNTTIEFLDIGHNRIRQTGLRAICDGIVANPKSKLTELGIRANFINDNGINYLFEQLIINRQQIKELYLKQNFLSEYVKIELAQKIKEKKVTVFVDEFRAVDYLVKERLDRSIWISPATDAASIFNFKDVLQR
jgi:Ran GTPase-activating protein (RanGAP) involved in mRNA processing and transport